jgi:hypothetical protein
MDRNSIYHSDVLSLTWRFNINASQATTLSSSISGQIPKKRSLKFNHDIPVVVLGK